jgi:hypothetical protein
MRGCRLNWTRWSRPLTGLDRVRSRPCQAWGKPDPLQHKLVGSAKVYVNPKQKRAPRLTRWWSAWGSPTHNIASKNFWMPNRRTKRGKRRRAPPDLPRPAWPKPKRVGTAAGQGLSRASQPTETAWKKTLVDNKPTNNQAGKTHNTEMASSHCENLKPIHDAC